MIPAALLPSRPGGRRTRYEIQVRHGGRWSIEAVSIERDAARDLASRLVERWPIEAIRVVEGILDPAAGRACGCVVFQQERSPPPSAARAAAERAAEIIRLPPAPSPRGLAAAMRRRPGRRASLLSALSVLLAMLARLGGRAGLALR